MTTKEKVSKIMCVMMNGKVKQLKWNPNIATAFIIDKKPLNYEIYMRDADCSIYCNDICIGLSDTFDQAKAYAQEHFENLIRGCYE